MRYYLCILAAILVLLSVGGMADAATYSKEQIAQDPELQELINNVPAADPHVLEETRKGQNVKAVFGRIPQRAAGEETYDWYRSLHNVRANVHADGALKEYICPNGPVGGFGVSADNYFIVILYDEWFDCSDETVKEIHAILNEYAKKEGIENMPIVFRSGGPLNLGSPEREDDTDEIIKSLNDLPLRGGDTLYFTYENTTRGVTAGFAAKNGNTHGMITCAHPGFVSNISFYTNSNLSSYFGTSQIIANLTDAVFIPGNVSPKIYTRNGSQTVNVSGAYNWGIANMPLRKSGTRTGYQTGVFLEGLDSFLLNGREIGYVEIMTALCDSGDSGGPIYHYSSSTGKYKVVGITSGTPNGYGQYNYSITVYAPYGTISDELNISVLKA